MYESILLPATDRKKGRLCPLNLEWQQVCETEHSELHPAKFGLTIDIVSLPGRAEYIYIGTIKTQTFISVYELFNETKKIRKF